MRAQNSGGTSGNSGTITATTITAVPAAQAATAVATTSFSANWAAAAGATNYLLDVSANGSFSSYVSGYQNLSLGNVLTAPVSGLTAGATYYYRVRAQGIGGTSGNSGTISVTLLPPVPAAPAAQAASGATATNFNANWSSVSWATNYLLDVATDAGFTGYVGGYQNLAAGNVSQKSVTGLAAGADVLLPGAGAGGRGHERRLGHDRGDDDSAGAGGAGGDVIGSTGFSANWSAAAGATGYRLDVSANSSFSRAMCPGTRT